MICDVLDGFLVGFGIGWLACWLTELVVDPWTGGQGSAEQFYPRWRLWLMEWRERRLMAEQDRRPKHDHVWYSVPPKNDYEERWACACGAEHAAIRGSRGGSP